jgi:hypothetical protein
VCLPLGLPVLQLLRLQVIVPSVLEAFPSMDNMEAIKEDTERRIPKARGWHNPLRDLIFTMSVAERKAKTCRIPWEKIKDKQDQKEDKGKASDLAKGKAPESIHYIVAHCNIGVNEDLFNTSFASWRDAWLFNTGATCHMTFRKDFFEDFNDNIDDIVYFADKSSLKPSGIGIVGLKLPRFPDFLLHNVLYLPKL